MRFSALLILAAMAAPAGAAAPEPQGPEPAEERDAVLYGGLGLSRVSAGFSNLSDALNLNVSGGAHLPWATWLSGELELSFTIAPGNNSAEGTQSSVTPCTVPPSMVDPDGTPDGCGVEVVTAVPGSTASRNDLQMTNLGAFAVLRSPGRVYAMGRYGYRFINTSIDEIEAQDDEVGTAYSVGAGYRWRKGLSKFELAYTQYSEHLEYLGLGVVYGFGGSSRDVDAP